jgi:branched-subunit amino acid ABC-type transport system permease component
MNPIRGVQEAIQNGWQTVLAQLQALNPIPEALRPLLGSRYFWFALWISAFSAFGRNLLGERIGAWAGLAVGGLLWYGFVPNAGFELGLLVIAIVLIPLLGTLLNRTNLGRRARGLKLCPDCAEDVKGTAKVCKHCGYRFEGSAKA